MVINYIPAKLNTGIILLLTLIDLRPPLFLRKYQIQEKKDVPIRWRTLLVLFAFWLFNKFIIGGKK